MTDRKRLLSAAVLATSAALALGGCKTSGEIVVDQDVGITAVRGACPAVGIPEYTGDITTFRTPDSTLAADLDVVAAMTNVKAQCNEADTAAKVVATATFDVLARRTDTRGARTVTLPYFVTVLRGGSAVIAKRTGTVTLQFADGQERAKVSAQGSAFIDRAEATLSEDIRKRLVRKRKAGDADAAVDPLSEPEVRAAVNRATFEVLVGFQLDDKQLAYNVTR
jgi:hypothetical protein